MSKNDIPVNVHEEGTGAVRSNDLATERWDLISGVTLVHLKQAMNLARYERDPRELVERSVERMWDFLGYIDAKRLEWLADGWACLATAIQLLDMQPGEFEALKSSIGEGSEEHYPYYAIRRLSTTCHEGAEKYAEHNWLHGFQVGGLANHGLRHLTRWTNGSRLEDDLGHTMWSFMAIFHMMKYRPDMQARLVGPNYTITDELRKYHQEHASRRNALKAKAEETALESQFDKKVRESQRARGDFGDPPHVQRSQRGEAYTGTRTDFN